MILDMKDKMPWGKFKGHVIENMINTYNFLNAPTDYLWYAITTWDNVTFTKQVIKQVEENRTVCDSSNTLRGDYGHNSGPGDYLGLGACDMGVPNC